ncbi:hypothetical protein ER57_00770 [Smithella sp. SCADC]|jgi:hypothetical protein|nr:hypothetical protein ER57_00770 [Smithella sp. SCADC]
MASKSKDVRIEQLKIFQKRLDLRLQQLAQKGIGEDKAQKDPLVKSLKSKIKETNVRIAAFEKFVKLTEALAQAKVQKMADLAAKKEEKTEQKQAQPKQKKADKEPKKQPAAADEEAPKKPKKQSADADEEATKNKSGKKKEE